MQPNPEMRLPSEMDFRRSAWQLIMLHGTDALKQADLMMWKMIHRDDVKGASTWMAIERSILDLLGENDMQPKPEPVTHDELN